VSFPALVLGEDGRGGGCGGFHVTRGHTSGLRNVTVREEVMVEMFAF
jgi:hypothetical protein